MTNNCLLYLISPPQIDDLQAFAEELESALKAGQPDDKSERNHIGAFQLRLKLAGINSPAEGMTTLPIEHDDIVIEVANILRPICHKYQVSFIVNDSSELAIKCQADGVHIGQEDGNVKDVRKIVGDDMVIGVTCHDSRHLAMCAAEDGADYVAFGAFYPTTSKTKEALAKWGTPTTDMIKYWSTYTEIPCVAIGGINIDNCQPLIDAGADFIAIISAVWEHPEGAGNAVEEFVKLL